MVENQNAKMRKKTHSKKKKQGSLKINLSNKDLVLLNRYCLLNKTTPKKASKKILHEFLSANVTLPEDIAKNQLNLFSPRETDIFDYLKEE